eukprot:g3390.t1
MDSMTCKELKSELRKRRAKVSGTKAELRRRLLDMSGNDDGEPSMKMFRNDSVLSATNAMRRRIQELESELKETKRNLQSIQKDYIDTYWPERRHEKYDYVSLTGRLILFAFLGVYIFSSAKVIEALPHVDAIFDLGHHVTEPLSDWMTTHPGIRNPMVILHAILMDGLCALMIIIGLFYDRTLRIHVAMFTFYTFRNLCQVAIRFPLPDKWRFHDPGFPSVLISYEVASDFYFSGHAGSAFLAALEFRRRGMKRAFVGTLLFCASPVRKVATAMATGAPMLCGNFATTSGRESSLASGGS